ncbi:hypothetical protein Agub_g826 [Astrephomene gubernaculifera]|uniref:Uncharacterized protein n=1 Tax=Astrephomene gubernaculifera TaxID=47775 RepID=A0AAD3DFD5_9CHLO|nr:hypothetical protein Agub_g826 [Astrephomene gubernaculifera]
MPCGAQLRLPFGARTVAPRRCVPLRRNAQRIPLMVRAGAEMPGSAPDEGPREVSLTYRFPGAGATFMLAGALKIMTIGWIATGAPRECVRTVAGQYAQFLLLPIGLLLCLVAKKIVDSGLHESRRFMAFLLAGTAFLYFGLYSVLYRYEPRTWHAQQRIQASASHSRALSPHAEELAAAGAPSSRRSNKFIIQRQLEGEYDARTAAYYARAPEMQMQEVEAQLQGLPAGMLQGAGGGAAAGAAEADELVGSSVAERRSSRGRGGPQSRRGRAAAQRRAVLSMYESTSRMPGLDDSEF